LFINICIQLKEKDVRMHTAARLLLGPHNELKHRVIERTEAYIDSYEREREAPVAVEAYEREREAPVDVESGMDDID
jgi:hypothetical protein